MELKGSIENTFFNFGREWNRPQKLGIKLSDDQNRPFEAVVLAVLLKSNVRAKRTPPDLTFLE